MRSNRTGRTTSSRTTLSSRRLFLLQRKAISHRVPSLLLTAKSPACVGCSVVNALATPLRRYQLFAGRRRGRVVADYTQFATAFSFAKKSHLSPRSVAPPCREKPRLRRLLGCKRPRDGKFDILCAKIRFGGLCRLAKNGMLKAPSNENRIREVQKND